MQKNSSPESHSKRTSSKCNELNKTKQKIIEKKNQKKINTSSFFGNIAVSIHWLYHIKQTKEVLYLKEIKPLLTENKNLK